MTLSLVCLLCGIWPPIKLSKSEAASGARCWFLTRILGAWGWRRPDGKVMLACGSAPEELRGGTVSFGFRLLGARRGGRLFAQSAAVAAEGEVDHQTDSQPGEEADPGFEREAHHQNQTAD